MPRILICGDRRWTNFALIDRLVMNLPKDSVIIEGDCRGADVMGGAAAQRHGLKVEVYPAEWDKYHKGAGMIRNKQMLEDGKPTEIWAFHDDIANSKGTKMMIELAMSCGIPCTIYRSDGTSKELR